MPYGLLPAPRIPKSLTFSRHSGSFSHDVSLLFESDERRVSTESMLQESFPRQDRITSVDSQLGGISIDYGEYMDDICQVISSPSIVLLCIAGIAAGFAQAVTYTAFGVYYSTVFGFNAEQV